MWDELTKLLRHAAVYGVGRILSKGISLFLLPFYTYYLTPVDYGVMEILSLVIMLGGMLVGFGISSGLMRHYYATENEQERRELVGTALVFSILSAALIAAPAFFSADFVSRILLGSVNYAFLVKLAAMQFFFSLSADIGWVYLRAKKRSTLYVTLTQIFLGVSLGLTVYLVAVKKMGLTGVFWGNAVAAAVLWVVLIGMTLRDAGLHFSTTNLLEMLRFGSPLILTWIAAYVLNYSDRFFLQRFSDLTTVGLYSLAYKFGFMVSMLGVQPFLLIWEAQAYEIAKREDAQNVFAKIFTYWSTILIAVGFLLSLYIREIFAILVSQKFGSSYFMVAPIALAYVIQGMGVYFEAGLLIQKKSKLLASIGVICTTFCLGIEMFLIYYWKSWGACASTVFSFLVFGIVTYWFSHRAYPIHCNFKAVSKVGLIALAILGVGWALPFHAIGWRLMAKTILALLFVTLLFTSHVFPAKDIASLRELMATWTRTQLVPKLRWAGLI
jgi:O-antigen/teichoic acid export membrane protein